MHRSELVQVATHVQRLDDRQLADVCFGEFCFECAALHADDVSNLHSLRPAGGKTSVVRSDNDLVDPLPVVLHQLVYVGPLGFLRLEHQFNEVPGKREVLVSVTVIYSGSRRLGTIHYPGINSGRSRHNIEHG